MAKAQLKTLGIIGIAVAVLGGTPALNAEPFVPASDDEVLERLPSAIDPSTRELRALRQRLAGSPEDAKQASRLARRYIEVARAHSDPRYYGYAQGVLQPWWHLPTPPVEVLVLRATIRQNRHEFEGALDDLAQLLSINPRHAQAWLTQAVIQQVRGEYALARRSCMPLLQLADTLLAIVCLASVGSLEGQAASSYELLARTLDDTLTAPREERGWALTTLAEIAVRRGRYEEAEQPFKEALALGEPDAYLLGAYADFLLDQDRPHEVRTLLGKETRLDGLLLRLALAEHRLGDDRATLHRDSLRARFAASRRRGDRLHEGEEARFTLHLLKQPHEALVLAQSNWAVQREPRDARILLEAAIAANDPAAARPVVELIERTGLEDVRLAPLIARLKPIE